MGDVKRFVFNETSKTIPVSGHATERDRDDLQWRLRSEVEESVSLRNRFSAMVDHFEGALHTLELKNEALQRETADRGRTLNNALSPATSLSPTFFSSDSCHS